MDVGTGVGAGAVVLCLRVQLLLARQHLDELLDATGSFFRFPGRLNSEQDCVSVAAIEGLEEGLRGTVLGQGSLEILRHGHATGRVIRIIPAPVGLGTLDFGEPGRFQRAAFDQSQHFFTIALRPDASLPARRELLQP